MATPRKHPVGTVFITTSASLANLAARVSSSLSIQPDRASQGRFDENEGYEGEAVGLSVRLLGPIPSETPADEFTYQLDILPGRNVFNDPDMPVEDVDISGFLELVLKRIPGIRVSSG